MPSPDITDEEREKRARRKRLLRRVAIAGAVLGLVCRLLPPRYQTACDAVAQVTSVTCGH